MKPNACRFVEDPSNVRKCDVNVAVALGLNEAMFIQQVHYHAYWKAEKYGTYEWRSSLSEWEVTFPFWSRTTIQRIIKTCREAGVLKARKEITHTGIAVWFSLDYEALQKLGEKGEMMIEKGDSQNDTLSQIDHNPIVKPTTTPSQIDQHLIKQSNTSSSTTIKRIVADAPISSPVKSPERIQEIRRKNRTKVVQQFEKSHSSQSVEKFWEMVVVAHFDRKGYIPLTVVDRKLISTQLLGKKSDGWCKKAGVNLLSFLEWCVASWPTLRDYRIKWPKLETYPTFRTIYNHKEKFLEHYRNRDEEEVTTTDKRTEIYTSMDQVPRNHPQYKQIKILIRNTGRAEVG